MRSEIDLVDVIHSYEAKYATTLQDDVSGDTSGDYKKILAKLLTIPEGMPMKEEEEDSDVAPGGVKAEEMGVGTETEPLEDLLAAIDAQEKADTEGTKEENGQDEEEG